MQVGTFFFKNRVDYVVTNLRIPLSEADLVVKGDMLRVVRLITAFNVTYRYINGQFVTEIKSVPRKLETKTYAA